MFNYILQGRIMKITLSGNQVDIGERLRSHVEENVLNAVNKYFPAPISCNVVFNKVKDSFSAEVTVHPAKNIILKMPYLLNISIEIMNASTKDTTA